MGNSVDPVIGACRATSRYPYPFERMIFPSFTTATAAPGTLNSCMALAMNWSKSPRPPLFSAARPNGHTAANTAISRKAGLK
ncbi:MAG: hypothetical protein U0Q18_06985 [Bryobacteraceae bacterium]